MITKIIESLYRLSGDDYTIPQTGFQKLLKKLLPFLYPLLRGELREEGKK